MNQLKNSSGFSGFSSPLFCYIISGGGTLIINNGVESGLGGTVTSPLSFSWNSETDEQVSVYEATR